MKEDSPDHPDPTLQSREKRLAMSGVLEVRKGRPSFPRKLPSVKGFV